MNGDAGNIVLYAMELDTNRKLAIFPREKTRWNGRVATQETLRE